LCKSVELRKLSRLAKYRCTKLGVPSLTLAAIVALHFSTLAIVGVVRGAIVMKGTKANNMKGL
jgi:hypothetical protein